MTTNFVRQFKAFLDLEAHGDNYTDYALTIGYDFLKEDKDPVTFAKDSDDISVGEQRAAQTIRSKVFPDVESTQILGQENSFLDEIAPRNPEEGEQPKRPNSEVIWENSQAYGRILEIIARHEGVSLEEAQERLSREAEDRRLEELRNPTLHRFLIRKYLARLDQMVDSVDALDVLPVAWSKVPGQLKILVSNAHEADLLGQGVACAVLCGTALEEALKISLGRDCVAGISEGILLAVSKNIFPKKSPEETAAWEINEMRNEATHDPGSYIATPKRKKRDVLLNTRFVLSHLFADNQV